MSIQLNYVRDGEKVIASTINRPTQQLVDYVERNTSDIETIRDKSNVVVIGVSLASNIAVGDIVCFNATTARFEKAVNQLGVLQSYNAVMESSNAIGIVATISTVSSTEDVNAIGNVTISGDYTGAISTEDSTHAYGMYYLSCKSEGKCTRTVPELAIPILTIIGTGTLSGTYRAIIHATSADLLTTHKHFKYSMIDKPCGSWSSSNADAIANSNDNRKGWLAADSTNFPNKEIPTNAVFGYNISTAEFATSWPPAPISTLLLSWKKEAQDTSGIVESDLVEFNQDGIWWLSSVTPPWSQSNFTISNDTVIPPLGHSLDTMNIWWTTPLFTTSNSYVESIKPASGSSVIITSEKTGEEASTGRLLIDYAFDNSINDTDVVNTKAINSLTDSAFNRGPVIAGIMTDSKNIKVVSSTTDNSAAYFSYGGKSYNYGLITIQDISGYNNTAIEPETIYQQATREILKNNILGTGFVKSINAKLLGKATIPRYKNVYANNIPIKIAFRFCLYLTTAGTVPSDVFNISYITIPYTDNNNTPINIDTSDGSFKSIAMNCSATLSGTVSTGMIYSIESEAQQITNGFGSTVLFYLSRKSTDTYNGDIVLLSKQLILYEI